MGSVSSDLSSPLGIVMLIVLASVTWYVVLGQWVMRIIDLEDAFCARDRAEKTQISAIIARINDVEHRFEKRSNSIGEPIGEPNGLKQRRVRKSA